MGWACGRCGATGLDEAGVHRCVPWSSAAERFACEAEARYLAERAAEPSRNAAPLLTPYELGVLLHYFVTSADYEPQTEATNQARLRLKGLRLMDLAPSGYQWVLSSMGRAYIDSLLRVPLPEAVWVTRWPQP